MAERVAMAEPLSKHGEIGNGRSRLDIINSTKGGTGQSYLIRRLKRDRPDIAEGLAQGKYQSVRAAALQAGIVQASVSAGMIRRHWMLLTG